MEIAWQVYTLVEERQEWRKVVFVSMCGSLKAILPAGSFGRSSRVSS
jgi:hypothetical protein